MYAKPLESLFLAVLLVGSASGATVRVPADFGTIQSAIDAVADGDEIVVAPGLYQERINYSAKEIQLRSSGGPHVTIIDGSGESPGAAVTIAGRVGTNTLFQGFTVTGGTASGMHVVDFSRPTIRDCIFRGNEGTFVGGGLLLENASDGTVVNCLFVDNTAPSGGGMGVIISAPLIVNCTFYRNVATEVAHFSGGGFFNLDGFIRIQNCIFWENSGPEGLEEQQIDGTPISARLTVDHCDIQGLGSFFDGPESFYGGVGNVDADPSFVDPGNGDFSPLPGSLVIDAGRNAELPSDIDTDLNGRARFVDRVESPDCPQVDADCGILPIVDMGAVESQGAGEPIPTVSQWGIVAMTLLILNAGSIIVLHRDSERHTRPVPVRPTIPWRYGA